MTNSKIIKNSIPPLLLIVLNFYYFGTFSIYISNSSEFLTSYFQIAYLLFLPALATIIILLIPLIILRPSFRELYLILTFALGVLSYLHGNILLWDYGVLDGNDLDLSNNWRAWSDAAIWIALFTVFIYFRRKIIKNVVTISSLLIVIQLTTAVVNYFQSPINLLPSNNYEYTDSLTEFSKNGNVIHIILDAFQADIFDELQSENPTFKNLLSGFTFFKNATTSSAVTYLSVPASLSSKEFQNKQPISDYLDETLRGDNLYSLLHENSYEIDVSTPVAWNKPNTIFKNYYRIPAPYSNKKQNLSISLTIFDLSIFRQVPHFLKSLVYNSQTWLFSSNFSKTPELKFEHFSHTAFLDDLSSSMTSSNRAPVYKFIHLVTPHAPMVSDKNCDFPKKALPYNRNNFKQQAFCAFQSIEYFIINLKKNDLYDSSLILIHGDHGGGVEFFMQNHKGETINSRDSHLKLWGAPLPLVLVKPPHESGPLRISNNEVQLSDIPTTISNLLDLKNNFQGRHMYRTDDGTSIERRYYWSTTHRNDASANDYYDYLYTYKVYGSVFKEDSWSAGETLISSILDDNLPYSWGSPITFGKKGISKRYQVKGWSPTSSDFITWNSGESATLKLDLPTPNKNVELVVNVKPFIAHGKLDSQRVKVYIEQNLAGEWIVKNPLFHEETMIISKELFQKSGSTEIQFVFPDAKSPSELGVNKDLRKLSLAFSSILFREKSDN